MKKTCEGEQGCFLLSCSCSPCRCAAWPTCLYQSRVGHGVCGRKGVVLDPGDELFSPALGGGCLGHVVIAPWPSLWAWCGSVRAGPVPLLPWTISWSLLPSQSQPKSQHLNLVGCCCPSPVPPQASYKEIPTVGGRPAFRPPEGGRAPEKSDHASETPGAFSRVSPRSDFTEAGFRLCPFPCRLQ